MMDPYFEIHEHQQGERVRLRLTGELDMASVPVLRNRLEQLRVERRLVRVDLSGLDFMDGSGVRLLISAFNHAREDGWEFEVDPDVSPQIERLFKVANLRRFTWAATWITT
jgi:anti-sigma B factor antagonist